MILIGTENSNDPKILRECIRDLLDILDGKCDNKLKAEVELHIRSIRDFIK